MATLNCAAICAANCAACGRENRDIAKYCRFCGKMLSASAAPSAAPQAKPAAAQAASPSQASVSTAPASAQSAPAKSAPAAATAIPFDYVGHENIRAELEKIKSNIKFQKKRQGAGVGGAIGSKIFIFKGTTGAGKTLVAKHFIEELRGEECLSSDRITSKEARELSKIYGDEYAIAKFLSETKPAALIVDNATEKPEYIHELILAASKSTQECICVIIGNSEGFEEFFGKNNEDRQRVTQDFNFQDLSLDDLSIILMKKLRERGLSFDPSLKKNFLAFIRERKGDPLCEYKNGWLIEKDVIPSIDKNQQARLERLDGASVTDEDFKTIKAEDLPLKNKAKTIDEILAELDEMTGMTDVKKTVREIANKIQIQKEQEEKDGTKSAGEGNNIVITGNPGTGKTTIVRTLGALFNAIGLLDSDMVIEVNGNDLKGAYLGESKDKVNQRCDEARGGILFVDEAYVLADTQRGSGAVDSFAKEAVEILMTRLENDRTKFVGVVAGYEKEMQIFLDKINPGMRRRFKHYLNLSDYNADELFAIFNSMVKKAGYTLTPDASEAAKKAITDMYNNKGPNFGNAGEIRVFFEKTTSRLATRLSTLSKEERADKLKTIEACDFPSDRKEERTVDEILAELDAMIGMTDIKKAVREIANKIQIQKEQEEKDGKKSAGEGNNIVLTGNPGTGKTTIVRTLGALFSAIGLLKTDNVIEVNGNDLKGTYLGESKDKVNMRCDEAMGGILFVDEAYVLADTQRGSGAADSYAKEAVEILMTRLENDRTKFVGVVAGYEKEMDIFLDKINPGMRRRFKHYLHLSDYSADELFAIFNSMVKKAGYTMTPDASEAAKASITDMFKNKGPNFGNAGEIRVFFEKTTSRLATRLSALSKEERSEKLKTIEACDIPVKQGGAS
jgi:AAA+ superfamily predicted ATPase